MPSFYLVDYITAGVDLDHSRIADLKIVSHDGTPLLFSTTRYDGVLESWQMATGVLSRFDTLPFDGGDVAGGAPSLSSVKLSGGIGLLSGGGTDGNLQTLSLNADGTFGTTTALSTLPTEMAGFQHGATVGLDDGSQAIYGALAGEAGIARLSFSALGALMGSQTILAPDTGHTDQIAAVNATAIAGQTYLFTANQQQNAVTSWAVGTDGTLVTTDHLGADDGLWIDAPTALQVAVVGGTNYLILGSAGSSTISVMEVGTDGALTPRDHVLDGLSTRFAGVTALDVVAHQGRTYVIAAGSDDGVSIFVLLEGGYLVPRATIEDTTAMGLDNVSAMAVQGRGNGLDLFVASSSEAGLTQLRFDTGVAGVTQTAVLAGGLLVGTSGDDILQGHNGDDLIDGGAGDDILRDGAGVDTLTGGQGADLFILSQDDGIDIVTDFTLGEDRFDLSLWPLLRDISQLTFAIRSYGMDLTYGDEHLIVYSADGQFIDYRDLTNADVIGSATRTGTVIEPGYPGPARPPPDTTPPDPDMPAGPGVSNSVVAAVAVVSQSNFGILRDVVNGKPQQSLLEQGAVLSGTSAGDVIVGGRGNDTISGGAGLDILTGGAGDDIINGGDGADIILGRAGLDTLSGGNDGDRILGGLGRDMLLGGSGNDRLFGGAGDDTLDGGFDDDLLDGGAGADVFIFSGGTDTIVDFAQGLDRITLDASVWTGLTSVEDVLFIYGSFANGRATIDLGDGNALHIDGVSDYNALVQDIDLF